MSSSVEKTLCEAAEKGRVQEVITLLKDTPGLNVNWCNETKMTALLRASRNGRVEVVKVLLAHPDIDVHVQSMAGYTAFASSCLNGHEAVVRVLLKDPRVDVTANEKEGWTPLWMASCYGHCEVVKRLIACGRDLRDIHQKGKDWGKNYTPLEVARKYKKTEVVSLLERFINNPEQTRFEVRVTLGALDELAAEVFALTVFLCDDLLRLKPAQTSLTCNPAAASGVTRFFAIAQKLPMELQMVLCRRVVGSTKQNILRHDSEIAFKSLVRFLLPSHA